MKYLKYVLRNATRNKLRSILTMLSVAICLAMMTVLYGFLKMQDALIPELARGNRILVMHRQGFVNDLPITTVDRVRAMPGVRTVIPLSWYVGKYKDEKIPFSQIATDAENLFNVWTELSIDPEQFRDWLNDRRGCVVDRLSAERRGWKIGELIPLQGNNYEVDLELTLRGIYDGPEYIQDLYFHWDYLDELLRQKNSKRSGTTSFLFAKAESAEVIPGLCEAIDQRFMNSDYPTLAQSHQEFLQMFSKFVGNIHVLIRNIGLAVLFSLTLVSANAMALSMRERTTEIAVLKAIGFQRDLVLMLVLGEALLICMLGGAVGIAAGRGLWLAGHTFFPQFVPVRDMAWIVAVYGLAASAAIGLLSGLVPASWAARLSVIDGLRRVV